jgi:hypothetical protein
VSRTEESGEQNGGERRAERRRAESRTEESGEQRGTGDPWRALGLLAASAIYGFSVGAVHSLRYAWLNVVKFPLLICASASVCAGVYFLVARLLAPGLGFADVRRLVTASYADLAALLGSLAPVTLFLATTLRPPASPVDLGEYPSFLAGNLALIAGCGILSVSRQTAALLHRHGLTRSRALGVVGSWLLFSLLVGGQAAWYLRPFFGNRAIPDDGSFCLGRRPDFRGAESFYEAVYHLAAPPRARAPR